MPGPSKIPILAISAKAFDEDRDRFVAAEMNDQIVMPVVPDAFYATVLHWFQKLANTEHVGPAGCLAKRSGRTGPTRHQAVPGR